MTDNTPRGRRPACAEGSGEGHPGGCGSDFEPVDDPNVRRMSVATAIAETDTLPAVSRPGRHSNRLLGTLVHRLVRRFGLDSTADVDAAAVDLLEPGEIVDIPESATVCAQAANAFRALCSMADVRDLYHGGTALHEVPFTLRLDGRIVRGTIDCLVVKEDAIVVLEFKTGRRAPGARLSGRLVWKSHAGRASRTSRRFTRDLSRGRHQLNI